MSQNNTNLTTNTIDGLPGPVIDEDALIDAVNEWITGCQYSFVLLIFASLLFFVAYTKFCHYFLSHFCVIRQNYNALDDVKQRKIIVYLSSIIVRCPAAFIFIYMGFKYWTLENGFYINDCIGIKFIQILSVEYSTLMIFELIKLPELSWDMWVHHMIVITLACTLMDPSILNLPFRTDPYYVESTIALIIGGSIMFIYQVLWVYFHLLQFDKPTIATLRRLNTVTLKDIQLMHQTSLDDMMEKHQSDSKYLTTTTTTTNTTQEPSIANNHNDNNNDNNGNNNENDKNDIVVDGTLGKQTSAERFKIVDSVFYELEDGNVTDEKLKLNRDSTKMKKNILKFRLYFLVFVIIFWFGMIPFGLWIKRALIDNNYQKEETKWFLITMLSLNLCIEIYVFRLLYIIYRTQLKKYRKYKLTLDTIKKRDKTIRELGSRRSTRSGSVSLNNTNGVANSSGLPSNQTELMPAAYSDNPESLVTEQMEIRGVLVHIPSKIQQRMSATKRKQAAAQKRASGRSRAAQRLPSMDPDVSPQVQPSPPAPDPSHVNFMHNDEKDRMSDTQNNYQYSKKNEKEKDSDYETENNTMSLSIANEKNTKSNELIGRNGSMESQI